MNKEHFIEQKEKLKGGINADLSEYMFEYYKAECTRTGKKILIEDQGYFNHAMQLFLALPLSVNTGNPTDLAMNMRTQTINKGIQNTIKYFDKQYEIS